MKVLFMGRKLVSANALQWSIDSGFDVVGVITDAHLDVSPTRDVAIENGVSLYTYDAAVGAIRDGTLAFDLGVSLVYWQILKEPFLSHPKLGIINFHPAPLPDYKGTGGYNVAIMDGLERWGVSAHYVDAGIDTGPIIEVARFEVDASHETALSLENKCQKYMLELFVSTMLRVKKLGILPTTRNAGGRYISRQEMEEMKKINSGDDIDRKIRAFWFPPYQGAYVELGGHQYTVVNSMILEQLADPSLGDPRTDDDRQSSESY
jgi:methionyl-tRNA formyltransferase